MGDVMITRAISFAALAAFGSMATGASAATVRLEFDALASVPITSVPYSEGGYTVDGSGTSDGRINSTVLTDDDGFSPGETFVITNDSGALFSLDAFDAVVAVPGEFADAFQMLGYLSGALAVDYGSFELNAFQRVTTGDATLIDELRIVGTKSNIGGINWDRIDLTAQMAPVPLPAAGWLLLAGLGGLVALRRRTA